MLHAGTVYNASLSYIIPDLTLNYYWYWFTIDGVVFYDLGYSPSHVTWNIEKFDSRLFYSQTMVVAPYAQHTKCNCNAGQIWSKYNAGFMLSWSLSILLLHLKGRAPVLFSLFSWSRGKVCQQYFAVNYLEADQSICYALLLHFAPTNWIGKNIFVGTF